MKVVCARCGKSNAINSRLNVIRKDGEIKVTWHGICSHCGTTSRYEGYGQDISVLAMTRKRKCAAKIAERKPGLIHD